MCKYTFEVYFNSSQCAFNLMFFLINLKFIVKIWNKERKRARINM
jgi:hypothetical protein